jgi:hypothetical protein
MPDMDVILEEVQKDRRQCQGFYRYLRGWSPQEHRALVLRAADNRQKHYFAFFGFLLGVLATALVNVAFP